MGLQIKTIGHHYASMKKKQNPKHKPKSYVESEAKVITIVIKL